MKTTSVNRWFYVLWKLESMCTVFIAPNLPFSKVGYTHTLLLGQRWWVIRDSLMAQMVKSLPAMRETWVQSLGRKDPLEVKMATRSSILAWKIPWTEEPGGLQSIGSQKVGQDWVTSLSISVCNTCDVIILTYLRWWRLNCFWRHPFKGKGE